MDRYTRAFVLASLCYLAAGGVLGALMRVSPETYPYLRFTHVHFLLGGFMAMMVFGVGYFILPRFASRTLRWPRLVAVHFWLANVSLLAMTVSEPLETISDAALWSRLGEAGAILQAASFLLFTVNLAMTLVKAPAKDAVKSVGAPERGAAAASLQRDAPAPSPATASFGPQTPVAMVVDQKEGALELLVAAGIQPLQDPAHLEMVRARGVPLGHACSRHGIPLDDLLSRLRALPDRPLRDAGADIGPDQIIGALVDRHPAARDVLRRHFGEGCFTCPGFATETLAQGALMHGVEVEHLLAELRQAIRQASG